MAVLGCDRPGLVFYDELCAFSLGLSSCTVDRVGLAVRDERRAFGSILLDGPLPTGPRFDRDGRSTSALSLGHVVPPSRSGVEIFPATVKFHTSWARKRGETMAIVVLSETPNMTKEQFDKVAAELGLDTSLPEGCRVHIAGDGPDGSTWRDISVWDSPAQAKQYMDTSFRPAIERAGATAIWGPPITWEPHKLML